VPSQGQVAVQTLILLPLSNMGEFVNVTMIFVVTVTKATGRPLGRGSGSSTLMLTPISQDRCIRPKRLMHAATPPPASR